MPKKRSSAKRKPTSNTRGAQGRARVEDEINRQNQEKAERAKQGHMPFRLYLKPGTSREVIVVDDEPWFFRYEHNLKNPRTDKWDIHTGCTKEEDNCPVCEEYKESYYALYLTVIDLNPFTDSKGNRHEFSRKLLVAKTGQSKKFIRKFENEGTLRGAVFELNRDGNKDPVIGNDIELIEFEDEEILEGDYKREWEDKDGKVHKEDCSEPFDYEALFPVQTSDELMEQVGGKPSPGSRRHQRESLGEDEWDEDEEKEPWKDEDEEEEKPKSRRSSRGSKRGSAKKDETEEPSKRSSKRKSSRRASRTKDDSEDVNDGADSEEEEKPRSRRGAGSRRGRK